MCVVRTALASLGLGAVACGLVPGAHLDAQQHQDTLVIPLDSVVVTVLRSPTFLGSSPFAISLLGREELQRGKTGASLEEAVQALPGVQIQNRYNYSVGERVSIRGFGARAQFGVRGIRVLVDGIPATLPDGQTTLDHLDLGSLGSVQALRGPGSALYGNAAGGVLAFETEEPGVGGPSPTARAVTGSDGLVRLQGRLSGTSGPNHYLLNVSRLTFDGFRTNPTDPGSDPYGRAERLNVNGTLTREIADGEMRVTLNFMDLSAENPGGVAADVLAAGERAAHGFNITQGARKDVQQGLLGVRWQRELRGSVRTEVAVYGLLRELDNPIAPRVIELSRSAGGVRTGIQGPLLGEGTWSAGVEFEAQRDDRKNFANEGAGLAGALTLDQLERVGGTAGFAQISYPIGGKASVQGSLRYDRVRFEVQDRFPLDQNVDDSGIRTLDEWSPSLGVHVQIAPELGLYGNVSTSFETPTTTELANRPDGSGGFNPELDPRDGRTFEVGARGQSGTASYELVVFRTDLSGELIPFEVAEVPGRTFFRNAGSATRDGIEASLRYAPRPWLNGIVSYSHIDASFDEYVVEGKDLGDNAIPGLAPNRLDAVVTLLPRGGYVETRLRFTDDIPVDDANENTSPSYWLADLRAGLSDVRLGRVSFELFGGVTNLFDREYNSAVTVNAFGSRFFEPGPGRSFYVGLQVGGGS